MKLRLAVPLAFSLGLFGCASSQLPPPLPEVRYAAPAPGMVWVAGSWHHNGTELVWLPGRWESPPPTP